MTGTARLRSPLLLVVLAALIGAGYAVTLDDFFLSDDFRLLWLAAHARGVGEASGLGSNWGHTWLRPVGLLGWWLAYRVGGMRPLAHHLLSLAIHLLNGWLLAWLVLACTGRRWAAWIGAMAFALFPILPEAVTWLAARYELLSTAGLLAMLLCWRAFGVHGRPAALVGACAWLALALYSKETAVSGPFLAAAAGRSLFPGPRRRWLAGLGCLVAVLAAYGGSRVAIVGGFGGYRAPDGTSVHGRFPPAKAVDFAVRAVGALALPGRRAERTVVSEVARVLPLAVVTAAAVLGARAGLGPAMARTATPFLLMMIVAFAPFAGWAGIGKDNQGTRFLYLPAALACAAIGTILAPGRTAGQPRATVALTAVLAACYLTGLVRENLVWHEAAHVARTALDQLAALAPARVLVVTELPDNYKGAYVFRNGFEPAVSLFMSAPHEVRTLSLAEWRATCGRETPPGVTCLRWDAAVRTWRTESGHARYGRARKFQAEPAS